MSALGRSLARLLLVGLGADTLGGGEQVRAFATPLRECAETAPAP